MIYEKAPAKINLTLDVLSKRPDGYHDVEMIMTTVDLADRIWLRPTMDHAITIKSSHRFVPNDRKNLAYQAADLLRKRYRLDYGVEITLDKNIPIAAGLAGGSSDAAAALRGLNRLWELGLSLDELAVLGAEIGSDVSFCVYGGTAIARGRGEDITHLPAPPNCWVVLAKPTIGVSTGNIYGQLNLSTISHPQTERMMEALQESDYDKMCASLGNVLEPVTMGLHGEVVVLKEVAAKLWRKKHHGREQEQEHRHTEDVMHGVVRMEFNTI